MEFHAVIPEGWSRCPACGEMGPRGSWVVSPVDVPAGMDDINPKVCGHCLAAYMDAPDGRGRFLTREEVIRMRVKDAELGGFGQRNQRERAEAKHWG